MTPRIEPSDGIPRTLSRFVQDGKSRLLHVQLRAFSFRLGHRLYALVEKIPESLKKFDGPVPEMLSRFV
jgi:hypothetical protein